MIFGINISTVLLEDIKDQVRGSNPSDDPYLRLGTPRLHPRQDKVVDMSIKKDTAKHGEMTVNISLVHRLEAKKNFYQ